MIFTSDNFFLEQIFKNSNLDYKTIAFKEPSIIIMIGGDYGDGHTPIITKINITSPEERKEKIWTFIVQWSNLDQ